MGNLSHQNIPPNSLDLLFASKESGHPGIPIHLVHSPSHSSSEDDRPLSSFLSPTRCRKVHASSPALYPSFENSAPDISETPSVTPTITAMIIPNLPPSRLLLKATPHVPLPNALESLTRPVIPDSSLSIDPDNPPEGLRQAFNLVCVMRLFIRVFLFLYVRIPNHNLLLRVL